MESNKYFEYLYVPSMTPEQEAFLPKLLEYVKANTNLAELNEADLKWLNDKGTLHRYARARQWNIEKATQMMVASIEWRKRMKPETIRSHHIEVEARTGKVRVADGPDLKGRPIVILDNASSNTTDVDNQMRFLTWNFNRAVSKMPAGVEKFVVFINLSRWSIADTPPMRATQETMDILANQFCERLGLAICWDAPWIFNAFFNAIYYLIDPATRVKILFLSGSSNPDTNASMTAILGPNWKQLTGIDHPQVLLLLLLLLLLCTSFH